MLWYGCRRYLSIPDDDLETDYSVIFSDINNAFHKNQKIHR